MQSLSIFANDVHILFTAPYHITQPSTDNDVQIVSPTATSLDLRCSLNVTIPAGIMITWSHNGRDVIPPRTTTEADTVTNTVRILTGGRPQLGVYQCVFNDPAGYILRRNITVLGTYSYIVMFYMCT